MNTCRIFNELEVDELAFLDITASRESRKPNYRLLNEIASECFMPVSYGGGISSIATAEKVLQMGFEKVILNTWALRNSKLIKEISKVVGRQSVVASIDVKANFWGKQQCRGLSGSWNGKRGAVEWAKELEELGAGEILLTSIDREGTWEGYDLELIKYVSEAVTIPVIAHGGAGTIDHIGEAVKRGASAVALGSMVVFQKKGMGVLINFPDSDQLDKVLR